MPSLHPPGIALRAVDAEPQPLALPDTTTAAFIGETVNGPRNEAVLLTHEAQYTRIFGHPSDGPQLAHAVRGFFENGGRRAYVCNVASAGGTSVLAPAQRYGRGVDSRGSPTGVAVFEPLPEIALLAAPGRTEPSVQDALLAHCEARRHCLALLDAPEDCFDGLARLPRPRESVCGAYFFPWLKVSDLDVGTRFVPPSGHIAGLYARLERERGVWTAPENEIVRGVLATRVAVSRAEQDFLTARAINCVRHLGERGVRVFGARTTSSGRVERFTHHRRLCMSIERAFEHAPAGPLLSSVATGLLHQLWRSGALKGGTPEEAFQVRWLEDEEPPGVLELDLAFSAADAFETVRVLITRT